MNLDQIRKDCPACTNKLFFNSAGSSLMPRVVQQRVRAYLDETAEHGGYPVYDRNVEEIETFYDQAAGLLNCQPNNIAFAHSATHGYIRAFSSIPFEEGDILLTSDDDYVSNYLNFLSFQKRFNIRIVRGKNLDNGDLDLDSFEEIIKQHHPKLVAITHIPTNSGLIQDVESIGKLCRQYDCWYLLDACQSIGQMPVDVMKIGCDFATTTGRKFLRGPRGTGILYVSDKALDRGLEPMFMDMQGATWMGPEVYASRTDAKRYELSEVEFSLLLGLKEAIKYLNDLGIESIFQYNKQLMQHLRALLSDCKGVRMYDNGSQTSSILTFRKENLSLEEMKVKLDEAKVYYSIGTSPHAVIDYRKKGIDWLIRLSPHYFNSVEEINQVVSIIEEM